MVKRSKRWDRVARKLVPSTATLSRNPAFIAAGRMTDAVWKLAVPEFRQLPPNHLRVRVGVGNQLFANHALCLRSGTNFWFNAFAEGLCGLDSHIVEIGCGYGRKAMHLRNYTMQGERFSGSYLGVDIDPELLGWAGAHFPAPQFAFQLTPHVSATYVPGAAKQESGRCVLEAADASQDFLFSTSLFTHLLEGELVNYVEESARVLKPGGVMQMNVFWLEHLERAGMLGSRWTFAHRAGRAFVENQEYPEAAVAYRGADLEEICRSAGFTSVELLGDAGATMAQSFLRARR